MKKKNFFLVAAILLFTAFGAVAQNAAPGKHSVKEIVPFGGRLPLTDLSQYPGRPVLGLTRTGISTAFIPNINSFNANEIKKDPQAYRKKLLSLINRQSRVFHRNDAEMDLSNGNSQNSNFHLAKDINALAESYPTNNIDFTANTSYAILDHVLYFAADDGIHGTELWRSDGTPAGTYLLKDVEPGPYPILLLQTVSYIFLLLPLSMAWSPGYQTEQKPVPSYLRI